MSTVVVGIDHSAGSKAALRCAFDEAKLRHAKLCVIHVTESGYTGAPGLQGSYPLLVADIKGLRDAAEAALEATIREMIPDSGEVQIETRVIEGRSAATLVEESRGADLLVVGSRGHGGFTELLLGSVSHQCAHHAECPVLIVRAPH